MTWQKPCLEKLVSLLTPPSGKVRIALDTDTYNEIDDQFAIVQMLLSDSLQVETILAAPFLNERCSSPGDGMKKSYEEILRVLERLGVSPEGLVFRGSDNYLPAADKPVKSAAAEKLVELGMKNSGSPLYVAAIGAPTNVASALLLEPKLAERIVVVWLGGHPLYWHTAHEFNLRQDLYASRVLFDSGVPLVLIPCQLVAEQLRVSLAEIEQHVKGKSAIGDYLHEIFVDAQKHVPGSSRVIWDMAAIAYCLNPAWAPTVLESSPLLNDNVTYSRDPRRHPIRVAQWVNRDAVFKDFFTRLA
jgi:inosine-uridine nucleoside N-ribohydrolase